MHENRRDIWGARGGLGLGAERVVDLGPAKGTGGSSLGEEGREPRGDRAHRGSPASRPSWGAPRWLGEAGGPSVGRAVCTPGARSGQEPGEAVCGQGPARAWTLRQNQVFRRRGPGALVSAAVTKSTNRGA